MVTNNSEQIQSVHYDSIVPCVVVEVLIFFSLKKYYKTTILGIFFPFTKMIFIKNLNNLTPFLFISYKLASDKPNAKKQIRCFSHLFNTDMCRVEL